MRKWLDGACAEQPDPRTPEGERPATISPEEGMLPASKDMIQRAARWRLLYENNRRPFDREGHCA